MLENFLLPWALAQLSGNVRLVGFVQNIAFLFLVQIVNAIIKSTKHCKISPKLLK